jgi:antitoxin StbD
MRIASKSVSSISELKRAPNQVISEAEEGPVAILNRNRPVAYRVTAAAYEKMIDLIEDLQDAALVRAREGESVTEYSIEQLRDL